MTDCWYIPEIVEDQRAENRLSPNKPGSYEKLAEAGVFYRHYNPDEISDDVDKFIVPFLNHIKYEHYDICILSPEGMGEEAFDNMAKQHFQEHLHEDDEVRLLLDGAGYFDIRDKEDKWIRVFVRAGDAIVVPAGIYHRFSTNPDKYTKTVRLFKTNPRWLAIPRGPEAEKTPSRQLYLKSIHDAPTTAVGPAQGWENQVFSFRFPDQADSEIFKVLSHFAEKHTENAERCSVIFFVVGSNDPHTGKSWCPPCATSKPVVGESVEKLRARSGATNTLYFELPVERPAYLGNPNFLYRKHPLFQVKSVPTVILASLVNNAASKVKSISESQWSDLLQVRFRTDEPEDISKLATA